jgi:cysteinyl-tRNA synthetase
MDWTAEKARQAEATLTRWYDLTDGITPDAAPDAKLVEALADDLNTHAALERLHQIAKPKSAGALKASMAMLGFADAEVLDWFRRTETAEGGVSVAVPMAFDAAGVLATLSPKLLAWQGLRDARDFASADALKARLEATGLRIEARPAGPHASVLNGFDIDEAEALQ